MPLRKCLNIILIEGYKNELHPKIEIIKEDSNDYLFLKLKNVIALISDKEIDSTIVQFKRTEIDKIAKHILNNVK